MILEKGNMNKLEERFLAYLFNLNNNEPRYPVLTAFANPLDKSGIVESLNGIGAPEIIKEKIESTPLLPCFSNMLLINERNDLDNLIKEFDDVYNAGKALNINMAKNILESTLNVYFLNYVTQLNEKMKGDLELKEEKFTDNYRNYKKEDLRKKLYHFSGDLINSIDEKDDKKQARIVNELTHFVRNSNFLEDIVAIVDLARSDNEKRLDLINLHIEKIIAVYAEQYEKAADCRDQISVLYG